MLDLLVTAVTKLRPSLWTIAAAAVLTFAACTGGSGSQTPAAGTDAADGNGSLPSCTAIEKIDSYRYFIALKLESSAFQVDDGDAGGTPDPLGQFAEALTSLFRDMELEGAFVAPDRSQATLRFQDQELELRTIGDKSWIRLGATWQEQPNAPGSDVLLTPASICADLVQGLALPLSAGSGEQELVNGIETLHYHLDEADLKGLPHLLGRSGEEGLPSEFGVDVWLARDEGWPVRLLITAADVDEQGEPTSLELFMEFSDIDDPNIEIEPPPVSPSQT